MSDEIKSEKHNQQECESCKDAAVVLQALMQVIENVTDTLTTYIEQKKVIERSKNNDVCVTEWILYAALSYLVPLTLTIKYNDFEKLEEIRKLAKEYVESIYLPTKNKNITLQ